MRMASKEETRVPDYKSFLIEFDDHVASEKIGSGVSRALSYGFEMGDMVWGKVKSHPWWPGQIFNEAFASPTVRRMRKTGHVLVAFFGDGSYEWFDPAELIPFGPHLAENSKQTKSIRFVKAVEEAMDEICKRSALGLTCRCRNPSNFRPANAQGYFAVDVIDYEVESVYSSKQIQKARDSFSSSQTLSFLKRCALSPHECNIDSIKFLQKKAVVSAFRKAVFEELDETYQQAFGARSAYALVKPQEPVSRAPSRAPLSGPLVTAETLGDSRSSENAIKGKVSTKQDKKRREEAGDLMTVQFSQVVEASSQFRSSTGDHVLQRKTPSHQTPMKPKQTFNSSSGDVPGKESSVSKLSCGGDNKGFAKRTKARMRVNTALFTNFKKFGTKTSLEKYEIDAGSRSKKDSLHAIHGKKSSSEVGIKKVNVMKRFFGERDSDIGLSELKKSKKKESGPELNCDNQERRKALSSEETGVKKSSQIGSAQKHADILTTRNSELTVVQLLRNLQALSLDPFFESSDRSSFRAVQQFFPRFRSLAYQKRLAISHSSDTTENARGTAKPSKPAYRNDEPSKALEKRFSADHQQDIPSAKKLKKTNQEAKPVREKGDSSVPISSAKTEPEKKIAPTTKVIEPSPTMLAMKFPSGTYLPSTAMLKAKFARFGPLDQSAISVTWKSQTCRVVFMYKVDAQIALRYASGHRSLFGNVDVRYYLHDVVHKPKKIKTNEPILESLSQQAPPVHQPNVQLKSCLKNPDNDGNGNRGTTRVKFVLDRNIVPSTLPTLIPSLSSSQYSKLKTVNSSVDDVVEPTVNSSVDISEEMMKLLERCNDVVANVTSLLGYAPYHLL